MTEDTRTDPPELRQRRWPKLLLVVSLTFNVLVLSVIVGANFRDGRDLRRSPPPDRAVLREGGFMPFFEAMPRDARRRMTDAYRDSGRGAGPDRTVLAAEFQALVAALRAEPFEPAALSIVLETQHTRAEQRNTAGRTILIDQIAGMSPAERTEFADALEDGFRHALTRARGKPDGGRGANH